MPSKPAKKKKKARAKKVWRFTGFVNPEALKRNRPDHPPTSWSDYSKRDSMHVSIVVRPL